MEETKTLDKRYLALGDYQMLDKWIPVEDANPDEFGLDWVLIKYTEKINFGEHFCTPNVAEKRKDGLWHEKGYFYEESIKDFNQNYKVKYWRPIDGYLPKRVKNKEDKQLDEIMTKTETTNYPKELFYYLEKYYDSSNYETRDIVFSALKYGYAFRDSMNENDSSKEQTLKELDEKIKLHSMNHPNGNEEQLRYLDEMRNTLK